MQDFMVELMEPTRIWHELQAKREKLDRINAAATDISQHMHVDGISTHSRKSKVEENVIKAETLRDEITDGISRYIDAQHLIFTRLACMGDYYTESRYIETTFVWGKVYILPGAGRGGERTIRQVRRDALKIYSETYSQMVGKPAEGATV